LTSKAPRRALQTAKRGHVGTKPIANWTAPHAMTEKVSQFRTPRCRRKRLLGSWLVISNLVGTLAADEHR
jgi:hypothetical protein